MARGAAREYRLTPAALDDLQGIWIHSAQTWSADQADRYVTGITAAIEGLCAFPESARERTEFDPPVRLHRFRSHLIIYRIDDDFLAILRVVHARQHWQALDEDGP
jgi:toxin ParE1/3/4